MTHQPSRLPCASCISACRPLRICRRWCFPQTETFVSRLASSRTAKATLRHFPYSPGKLPSTWAMLSALMKDRALPVLLSLAILSGSARQPKPTALSHQEWENLENLEKVHKSQEDAARQYEKQYEKLVQYLLEQSRSAPIPPPGIIRSTPICPPGMICLPPVPKEDPFIIHGCNSIHGCAPLGELSARSSPEGRTGRSPDLLP
jgi:hypothetical protein